MRSMKSTWFILLVSLVFAVSAAAQSTDTEWLSVEERAFIASEIYAALPVYFAHWEGAPDGLDLREYYREYLSEALSAADRREFALLTMKFLAGLRNGHTFFWDQWLYGEYGQPLGFTARSLNGEWVITESDVEGLQPGDVIRTIDDEPVESFVEGLLPYVPASSEYAARALLFYPQRQEHLFPQRFVVGLEDGRSVAIDRKELNLPREPFRGEQELLEEGTVAYVRIPSFGSPQFEEAAMAFIEEQRDVPALIVDVRGNGGGNTPVDLIALLMDRPYRYFIEGTPMSPALLRKHLPDAQLRWREPALEPIEAPYRGRIVFVTDPLCGSACEDLLAPFKDNGRATIVGERTQGTTGQPYFERLDHGMHFVVGMKRVWMPDGTPFEGEGIGPDVVVKPTIEALRQGTDPVLDYAIDAAKRPAESSTSQPPSPVGQISE